MSRKGKKDEKQLANILLITAIIELLIKLIELLEKLIE